MACKGSKNNTHQRKTPTKTRVLLPLAKMWSPGDCLHLQLCWRKVHQILGELEKIRRGRKKTRKLSSTKTCCYRYILGIQWIIPYIPKLFAAPRQVTWTSASASNIPNRRDRWLLKLVEIQSIATSGEIIRNIYHLIRRECYVTPP